VTLAASSRLRTPAAVGVALVLVALNLRLALGAVPPVLDDIRRSYGLSSSAAGLLTTAPVLCFSLAAPLAPWLSRRLGQEQLLLACVGVIVAGIVVRLVPGVAPLFLGTVVLGVAIAVGNVIVPSIVKRAFPRPGAMMGAYTMSLSASAALGAGLTVPLEDALGSWRVALAVWALPAVLAGLAWSVEAHGAGREPSPGVSQVVELRRDRTAWLVTASLALQSFLFYALLGWTPDILRDAGLSSVAAGAQLSIAMVCGIPASLLLPVLAGRGRDQRALAFVAPGLWAAGLVGLLLAPGTATAVWMVLAGLGQGAGIAFALTLVVLRAPDGVHAASLSGMSQGVGYALGAVGPFALGALHDATGGWTWPLLTMLATTAGLLACGLGAGRDRFVRGRPRVVLRTPTSPSAS
jgi:CP family cyanate transporter-like MFS transporter